MFYDKCVRKRETIPKIVLTDQNLSERTLTTFKMKNIKEKTHLNHRSKKKT